MEWYKKLEEIAEENDTKAYSKYLDIRNISIVAVKCIPHDSKENGLPYSVLREISLLKELNHHNVVRLLDVVSKDNGNYIVFEHLDLDLAKVIQYRMNPRDMKNFLFQILVAVSYCHSRKVLHQDLNPQNLFIDSKTKTVKLSGFGFARTFDIPLPQHSTEGTTLAYRAPELLLGLPYSSAVDIWSVGCIFAEMKTNRPIFQGTTDTRIMSDIISMLGFPDEKDWPGLTEACDKLYESPILEFHPRSPQDLACLIPFGDTQATDLLSKMLCLIPDRRITAFEALQHPYFDELIFNI